MAARKVQVRWGHVNLTDFLYDQICRVRKASLPNYSHLDDVDFLNNLCQTHGIQGVKFVEYLDVEGVRFYTVEFTIEVDDNQEVVAKLDGSAPYDVLHYPIRVGDVLAKSESAHVVTAIRKGKVFVDFNNSRSYRHDNAFRISIAQ